MSRETVAHRIEVNGTVQGVGFRPFVWRLATELEIAGTVRNRGGRVEIEAYAPAAAVATLVARLRAEAPPLARVESVTVTRVPADAPGTQPPPARGGFTVSESDHAAGDRPSDAERLFPPDLATCDACLAELFDPGDRRFRYPFINCVDCGPRATIIDSLPYDRARTTMVEFPLCAACRAEYANPTDRRFHAEPIACPDCGPTLAWRPASGEPVAPARGEDALRAAIAALGGGGIVAVKGLGGYHLACDATSEDAVERLRRRKHRWAKPLAVMVTGLAMARDLAEIDEPTEAALTAPSRPIVLAPASGTPRLAGGVLAGLGKIGLFLPYTGTHHLLMAGLDRPLVLTSGNRSDEPIAVDDDEAVSRLAGIADGFLSNDRRIRSRYEDSVVSMATGAPALLRRGRGFAPTPLDLPVAAPEPVLAAGAQLKHTFAIAKGTRAHVASHIGDLEDLATLGAYQRNLDQLCRLLDVEPAWVAHDLHPGYLSTQRAAETHPPERRIAIQHHHAHAASCLAENGLTGPAVCVTLDGLGLGDDGTFWGGEILVADLLGYRRVGRFGRAPMPGGEAAVRRPWRMALGYLLAAEPDAPGTAETAQPAGTGLPAPEEPGLGAAAKPYLDRVDPSALRVIRRQVERGVNAPVASSAGRLFDAASALLGLCDEAAYEGQPAIALERAADPREPGEFAVRITRRGGLAVFDPRPTLAELLAGLVEGVPVAALAARFQRSIATAVTGLAVLAARDAGLGTVCLTGGVFGNDWLVTEVPRRLSASGFTVVFNRAVPAGDGGISLGQAAIAAARLAHRRDATGLASDGGMTTCA